MSIDTDTAGLAAQFHRVGFARLPELCDAAELRWLAGIFDRFFTGRSGAGRRLGAALVRDLAAARDVGEPPRLPRAG